MNFRWYPVMPRRGSGLTLIELLVATAALGLVGMLFLAALQTPKSNRRTPPTKSLQVSDVTQDLTAQPSDRQTPFVGNTSRTGPNKPQLVLRLVSMTTPVRLDQKKAICAILFNRGDAPATLVLPGDGSYDALRTPTVAWSVLPADDLAATHARLPTEPQFRKCGNLDSLTRDQVFTLRPGETRVVETAPDLPRPGRYRIRYHYRNEPEMRWKGIFWAEPGVMQQVRNSTPCSLVSNELVITAVE